jgi:hypothetical protein
MPRTCTWILLALTVGTKAQAGGVDWKVYGFVERPDGALVCFYDANSVTSATKLTRVWVKCIFQKELEDYGKQHRDHIRASALHKVNNGYVPPFVHLLGVNSERAIALTAAEEVADMGEVVRTRGRFQYELDCAQRKQRRLSAYEERNGKQLEDDRPGEWAQLPAESAGAMLANLLCSSR